MRKTNASVREQVAHEERRQSVRDQFLGCEQGACGTIGMIATRILHREESQRKDWGPLVDVPMSVRGLSVLIVMVFINLGPYVSHHDETARRIQFPKIQYEPFSPSILSIDVTAPVGFLVRLPLAAQLQQCF